MKLVKLNNRLDSMNQGQKVQIVKIHTTGKLMHKLLDMGFVNGSSIEVIREAPLFDPMELKLHNYNISLRKSEARLIEISIV